MSIVGYLRTSLIEWPGKIASVIFTPGCNFRCPFCHNSNLVDSEKIKKLSLVREEKIFADLKKRKKWIDGVSLTGGEPCLQSDLDEFLGKIKKLGFETMVETNGSLPEILKSLINNKLVDFIAMDYKTTFADYAKVVHLKSQISKLKDNLIEKIKKSMKMIIESGLPFEFRTTVVPTIHDEKVLLKMARELKKLNSQLPTQHSELSWVLQTFQPKNCLDPEFNKIKPFDQDQMERFLKAIQKIVPRAKLR